MLSKTTRKFLEEGLIDNLYKSIQAAQRLTNDEQRIENIAALCEWWISFCTNLDRERSIEIFKTMLY